jgi:Pyridine nucleotide-disulphide oxidoreductase
MISSPGCLCRTNGVSGLMSTRFWTTSRPGDAQIVPLEVGAPDPCACPARSPGAPAGSLRRGAPAPGTARARLKIVAAVCTFGSRGHHVVVVGGGFGGLQAVSKLRRVPVEVTLVDRRNFHLFQPLTYQVATGALSPGAIAYPLRAIFKRDRNVRVYYSYFGHEEWRLHAAEVNARECSLRSQPPPRRLRGRRGRAERRGT